MKLILASSSPRRRDLLEMLALEFDVVSPGVDESRHPGEPITDYTERVARSKAMAVVSEDVVVVAADTAVSFRGQVLGKPQHPTEAEAMLRRIQGETHETVTGIAVAFWNDGPVVESAVDVTKVEFLPMTDAEIADYIATGEPLDKAGAYALQGRGGRFVKSISGSPSTVIGLPIHLLGPLVARSGNPLDFFEKVSEGDTV